MKIVIAKSRNEKISIYEFRNKIYIEELGKSFLLNKKKRVY